MKNLGAVRAVWVVVLACIPMVVPRPEKCACRSDKSLLPHELETSEKNSGATYTLACSLYSSSL